MYGILRLGGEAWIKRTAARYDNRICCPKRPADGWRKQRTGRCLL